MRVLVDGRVHSSPVKATIRLESRDASRYLWSAHLMRLVDRQAQIDWWSPRTSARVGSERYPCFPTGESSKSSSTTRRGARPLSERS